MSSIRSYPISVNLDSVSSSSSSSFAPAFGDLVYAKIARTLAARTIDEKNNNTDDDDNKHERDDDVTTTKMKREALATVCDLLRKPENVEKIFNHEVFPELMLNLSSSDDECRIRASQAIDQITERRSGRLLALSMGDLLPRFGRLMSDPSPEVRLHTQSTLSHLLSESTALSLVCERGLLDLIIDKCLAEQVHAVKAMLFVNVKACVETQKGYKQAVEARLMQVLARVHSIQVNTHKERKEKKLTEDERAFNEACQALCECIATVAIHEDGKEDMVVCVQGLLYEIQHSNSDKVRTAAAHALANITNCQRGKVAAAEGGAVEVCVNRISDVSECSPVLSYVCYVLTNVAETPKAWTSGNISSPSTMNAIEALTSHKQELVKHAAILAKERILWKP